MSRFIYVTIITIAIIIAIPNTIFADKKFTDLNKKNSHYDGIQWLVTKGIKGYPDGSFGVDKNLTRPHAAIMFTDAIGLERPNKSDVELYFDDVKRTHEYADSIAAVGRAKIFTGSNGRFLPNNKLTREQMATTLVNAFDLKANNNNIDVYLGNVDASHKENVQIIANLNVTNQLEDFRPNSPVTRGQFATFLYRIANLEHENPVKPTPDEDPENPKPDEKPMPDEDPENPKPDEEPKPDEDIENTTPPNEKPEDENEPDLNNKVISTSYNYDFKMFVDNQMKAPGTPPQTDSANRWFDASRDLVSYNANPNNFKQGSTAYYQFLLLSESAGVSAKDLNSKVLTNKGVLSGRADHFIKAGNIHGVNEVYLISHALLETGNGTSKLATGIEVGLDNSDKPVMVTDANRNSLRDIKVTYNTFGIGAFDRCPLKCGSERAYEKGWFTHEAAIIGGAEFIGQGYIDRGQDTLYKMRWNPASPATHQYATDVGWAVKQTSRIANIYGDLENAKLVFDVPVYTNQPAASSRPTGAAVFHVNTAHIHASKKGITTASELNFRTGPTTNFSVIRQLAKNTEVTIIGENSGWYKVKAGNDEGWVSASYVQVGETRLASIVSEDEVSEQENEFTIFVEADKVIGETVSDDVIVRAVPDVSSENIGMLQAGVTVEILEEDGEWLKIRTDHETGWIDSALIRIDETPSNE